MAKQTYQDQFPITAIPYTGSIRALYSDIHNAVGFDLMSLSEFKKLHPNSHLVTWDELALHVAAFEESLKTACTEIKKELYWQMLEIMPPSRFGDHNGVEGFHICEGITGSLVDWFLSAGDKFYTFTGSRFMTDSEIAAKLIEGQANAS